MLDQCSPRIDFLCRASGINLATLERWRAAGIVLRPGKDGGERNPTRLDVMTAAVHRRDRGQGGSTNPTCSGFPT